MGEAITKKLAADSSNKIFFSYRRSLDNAKKIEAAFPNTKGISCDFSSSAHVEKLLSQLLSFDLDVLINNALTSLTKKHFQKIGADDLLKSFQENVLQTVKISQKVIEGFRKKKSGKVINILTSYVFNLPPIGLSEYVANKAYLESMSKSWAKENSQFNITSTCISPSMMRTNLTADIDDRVMEEAAQSNPMGRLVTVEEVAEVVSFLIHAPAQLNGVNIPVTGGDGVS